MIPVRSQWGRHNLPRILIPEGPSPVEIRWDHPVAFMVRFSWGAMGISADCWIQMVQSQESTSNFRGWHWGWAITMTHQTCVFFALSCLLSGRIPWYLGAPGKVGHPLGNTMGYGNGWTPPSIFPLAEWWHAHHFTKKTCSSHLKKTISPRPTKKKLKIVWSLRSSFFQPNN